MSWMQELYATYERNAGRESDGDAKILPVLHTTLQAHIEVAVAGDGSFRRALVVPRDDSKTVIPVTEQSGGRSGSKPVPHPLCDKLQYLAGDYIAYGGMVTSGYSRDPEEPHSLYVQMLESWSSSEFAHPKIRAVLSYVRKRSLIRDLVSSQVLTVGSDGQLLAGWDGAKEIRPSLFGVLNATTSQHESVVRWRVELDIGDPDSSTWRDQSLQLSWVNYYSSLASTSSFCMVTGRQGQPASNHPKKVRHERDQAKLLSSNDTSGYTFRGRFIDADQAASISLEASQKFHNALRWLIDRQAYRDGDQVFVAWSPTGAPVPNPTDGTGELFADDLDDTEIDVAETFAIRLRKKIWGYQAELDDRADVVVLGLDSATPGRIAVTYHRTLVGSEFLDRLEQWHSRYAWHQFLVVNEQYRRFVGVPAPNEIARAAYGRRLDDKLKRSTVERLIPCIVEARTVPQDIVRSVVRRASAGPTGFGDSANHRQAIAEWRRTLGIACGLFSGANLERDYDMTLETDRTSRDYLYGRLLATADSIESFALYKANENRITAAERLIQRFADHPFTTWRTIELSLRPYMARLQTGYPAFLNSRMRLMQDIKDAFDPNEFADPRPLSGEFLLGYDVQRRAFRQQGDSTPESSDEDASEQLDDEGID